MLEWAASASLHTHLVVIDLYATREVSRLVATEFGGDPMARGCDKFALPLLDFAQTLAKEFPAALCLLDRHAALLEPLCHRKQVNLLLRLLRRRCVPHNLVADLVEDEKDVSLLLDDVAHVGLGLAQEGSLLVSLLLEVGLETVRKWRVQRLQVEVARLVTAACQIKGGGRQL